VSEMNENDPKFMRWLVAQRSKNQKSCLAIFELLEKHPKTWQRNNYFFASQALIGAAFSLWRAVFLGNKTGKRSIVLKHSKSCLESVVLDNMISYPQDKRNNEWTFNYYLESARFRLKYLADEWPKVVPKWQYKRWKPMDRWEYAQGFLDKAVRKFEKHLAKAT
jgi:hypothetical protein